MAWLGLVSLALDFGERKKKRRLKQMIVVPFFKGQREGFDGFRTF
jgi:hypothetical protein